MKEGKIVPVEITCGLMRNAMEKAGGTVKMKNELFLSQKCKFFNLRKIIFLKINFPFLQF